MDGENFMENPIKMDDLGVFPLFLEDFKGVPSLKTLRDGELTP